MTANQGSAALFWHTGSYKRWKGGLIFFFPPANLLCASLPSAISKLANWDVDSQTPCSWFWGQYVLPVWIQETLEAPCNHAGFLAVSLI